MARRVKIQGETIRFSIDTTDFGSFTELIAEISKYSDTVLKFAYPGKAGYSTLTKTNNNYAGLIASSESELLEGIYNLELTFITATDTVKGVVAEYLEVTKESK